MKHVYELYTEWTKGRSRVAEGGIFKTVSECELEAFQAGMLAAADLAEKLGDQWTEADYHKYGEMTPSRSNGAEDIEFAIREAAK